MKKLILMLLVIATLVFMTVSVAFAADSSPTPDINTYLTWEFLGTMAGAVAATTLIVQFLKLPLDKVWKIPTRFLVYAIALLILLAVELFSGTFSAERLILITLNAVIVATSAMGTYEATLKKLEGKTE